MSTSEALHKLDHAYHEDYALAEEMSSYAVAFGASTQQLASKQSGSATNFMLIHPSFGQLMGWNEIPKGAPARLPPINQPSNVSSLDPLLRRSVDHPTGVFPPPWDPGVDVSYNFPRSPSRHCFPSPMLPGAPKLRARKSSVSTSTAPYFRLRPHTSEAKQRYERMYGPPPPDPAQLTTGGKIEEAMQVRAMTARLPPPRPVRRDIMFALARQKSQEPLVPAVLAPQPPVLKPQDSLGRMRTTMRALSIKSMSLNSHNSSTQSKLSEGNLASIRRNSQSGGILPPQAINAREAGIKTF